MVSGENFLLKPLSTYVEHWDVLRFFSSLKEDIDVVKATAMQLLILVLVFFPYKSPTCSSIKHHPGSKHHLLISIIITASDIWH